MFALRGLRSEKICLSTLIKFLDWYLKPNFFRNGDSEIFSVGISYCTCYTICWWIWAVFPAPNRNAKLSWLKFSSIICFNFLLVFCNSFLGFCQSQLENVLYTLSFERKDIVKWLSYQNKSNQFVIIHFVIFLPEIFSPTRASLPAWHKSGQGKFTLFLANMYVGYAECFWLTYVETEL